MAAEVVVWLRLLQLLPDAGASRLFLLRRVESNETNGLVTCAKKLDFVLVGKFYDSPPFYFKHLFPAPSC